MFSNAPEKLSWMYKDPGSSVNREEYLLGRPVDKALDRAKDEERSRNGSLKNYVDHECIPPSIRDLKKQPIATVLQVDLASKLKDDPLTLIQKQQEEMKMKLLKNPIKLKEIQEKLTGSAKKKKKPKKPKKKKSRRSSSTSSSSSSTSSSSNSSLSSLDLALMMYFQPIRSLVTNTDLETKTISESICSRSRSSSRTRSQRRSRNTSRSRSALKKRDRRRSSSQHRKTRVRKSRSRSRSHRRSRSRSRNRTRIRTRTPEIKKVKNMDKKYEKRQTHLTDEERNRKMREMMENADWREKERSNIVKKYQNQCKNEQLNQKHNSETFQKDYISKSLLTVANSSSVENQIRSKMGNVQRGHNLMDSNFCKKH